MNLSVKSSVSHYMSVITQDGDSALIMALKRWGGTEVVSLLLEAEPNTDLQNKVYTSVIICKEVWFGRGAPITLQLYLWIYKVPVVPFPMRSNHAEHDVWALKIPSNGP